MKRLFTLGLLSLLAGCTTLQDRARVTTDLSASEFNSVSSHYTPKPTFVSLETYSSGEKLLVVNMQTYAIDKYGMDSSVIRYSKQFVDSYLGFIDKYLSWEQIATERQDALTKEIGEAKSFSSGMDGHLKFTFYSGNTSSHYLSVAFCSSMICLDNAHYYDKENAKKLRMLLEILKADQFQITNLDDVYK